MQRKAVLLPSGTPPPTQEYPERRLPFKEAASTGSLHPGQAKGEETLPTSRAVQKNFL